MRTTLLLLLLLPLHALAGSSAPASASASASASAPASPSREHLAPSGWENSYHRLHYTPVLKIGDRVIVSGIPAIVGTTDEEKIRWAFNQLKAHLEHAGATMADVVELHSYHVANDHAQFRARVEPVLKVHREFFTDHYPAWTAVGTTALFSEGAPMEIRAEAVICSGARPREQIVVPAPTPTPAPAPAPTPTPAPASP